MRQSTIGLLAILACTLYGAWFYTTHEKITKTEFIGYRGEARVNDFLAADLLLNELGIEADSRSSLTPSEWLPDITDTLVSRLSTSISVLGERSRLLGWVADGGHLILMPPKQESRLADEFLGQIGFHLVEVDDDESDAADEKEEEGESQSFDYLVDLEHTWFRIETTEDQELGATLTDNLGIIAVRRNWGDGSLTVLANSRYFTNRSIDESDHARLLMDTVAGYVNPGKVWFIYNATFPSLWQVIWSNAPYVVISLAIVLVIWLWSIVPIFGPAIHPDPPVRRSIIEHVRAAGHFVWRNHGARALTSSSTAAVMHEAEFKHPGISRLSMEKQAKQIAKLTGLAAQPILDVLINRDTPRNREFTHNMQALQRIRKEL